jgi:hypothetical protein
MDTETSMSVKTSEINELTEKIIGSIGQDKFILFLKSIENEIQVESKSNIEKLEVVFHKGKPDGLHECSRCRELKTSSNYNYYSKRIDKNGYLMRSNALCVDCTIETNQERSSTLNKAKKNNEIGKKPEPGDICTGCNRSWGTKEQPRNWHRDHDAKKNEFRGWLCGDCNMAKHDHRHDIS